MSYKIEAEFRVGGRKFDGLPQAEAYQRALIAHDAAEKALMSTSTWGVSQRSANRIVKYFESASGSDVMSALGPLLSVLKARSDWSDIQSRIDGAIGKRGKS